MPAPVCKCSICGEEVSKSQTRHIGDGKRACKKHEGVLDKAQEIQAKHDTARRVVDAARAGKHRDQFKSHPGGRRHTSFRLEDPDFIEKAKKWAQELCWVCGRQGMHLADSYANLLVAMERLKLKDETTSVLSPNWRELVRREMHLDETGLTVINRVVLPTDPKICGLLIDKCNAVHKGADQIVELAGAVQICVDCAAKYDIEFEPKSELSEEQLKTGMIMAVLMRPAHEKLARDQLAAEGDTHAHTYPSSPDKD